jgi:hypothetical protein
MIFAPSSEINAINDLAGAKVWCGLVGRGRAECQIFRSHRDQPPARRGHPLKRRQLPVGEAGADMAGEVAAPSGRCRTEPLCVLPPTMGPLRCARRMGVPGLHARAMRIEDVDRDLARRS